MSFTSMRRGQVIGAAAAGALLLSGFGASGAEAAAGNGSPADLAQRLVATATSQATESSSGSVTAEATEDCVINGYSPSKITIGNATRQAKFTPKISGCNVGYWAIVLEPFLTPGWDEDHPPVDGVATESDTTMTLNPTYLYNEYAGKHAFAGVAAVATEDADNPSVTPVSASFNLTLQRQSRFESFNASPEPVKKGDRVTLKATLSRVNWNGAKHLKYIAYPKQTVQVQYKAEGAIGYRTVKSVKTDSKGRVNASITQTKSGRWRLVFAGISTTSPATSASDAVAVS